MKKIINFFKTRADRKLRERCVKYGLECIKTSPGSSSSIAASVYYEFIKNNNLTQLQKLQLELDGMKKEANK